MKMRLATILIVQMHLMQRMTDWNRNCPYQVMNVRNHLSQVEQM